MRIPTKIRVLHMEFAVEEMDWEWRLTEERFGECDFDAQILRVTTDKASTQVVVETLWHEVAHAINWVLDLDDDSSEEEYVSRTSQAWILVLRDNPMFRALVFDFCRGHLGS